MKFNLFCTILLAYYCLLVSCTGNNSGMLYIKHAAPVDSITAFGSSAGGWNTFDNYPRMVGDLDNDGQVDIIGFSNNNVEVSYSNLHIHFYIFKTK